MPDRFFHYLQDEASRLEEELARARAKEICSQEIARLQQLRQIVTDQLSRWTDDLSSEPLRAKSNSGEAPTGENLSAFPHASPSPRSKMRPSWAEKARGSAENAL